MLSILLNQPDGYVLIGTQLGDDNCHHLQLLVLVVLQLEHAFPEVWRYATIFPKMLSIIQAKEITAKPQDVVLMPRLLAVKLLLRPKEYLFNELVVLLG